MYCHPELAEGRHRKKPEIHQQKISKPAILESLGAHHLNKTFGSSFCELKKPLYLCVVIMHILTENKLQLIEEMGVLHEQHGMQPAAARILALLMISDTVELAFEEIYETLGISKSAASNAINILINTDRVEYITRPGERRRYFRLKTKGLKDVIQKSISSFDAMNAMLKRVLEVRTAETTEFNKSLKEITEFLDFLKSELPNLYRKWESRKN